MTPQPAVQRLRSWLVAQDMFSLQAYARQHRRALSFLTAITYDPDPQISWRAIHGLQVAGEEIAAKDPEYVRIHLRRLMWLLTDESGGIGWRAPEAMGALIAARPQSFGEFLPLVISILDMEAEDAVRFRAGALWSVGHLAQHFPDRLQAASIWLPAYFSDPDPQVRGMAVWAFKRTAPGSSLKAYPALEDDPGAVLYLVNGTVVQATVCGLANSTVH